MAYWCAQWGYLYDYAFVVAELNEESLDLVGEEDYEDEQADGHEFVEHCADEFHVEHLGCYDPHAHEGEDAEEEVERA